MSKVSNKWQLQEARNKLSQLVKNADKGVPQYITVHGKNTAVILSAKEYERLKRPNSKLSSALLKPLIDDEQEIFERDQDTGRTIDW